MTTVEIGGEGLGWISGWVSDSMGGSVRVDRAVGGALALGTVAYGSSEGVGVWDSWSMGRQRKAFICGSPGVWDDRSVRDSNTLFLVLTGQHGRRHRGWKSGKVGVGGREGVGVGWRQSRRKLGRRRRGWQRLLASARASPSGTAAGKGVGVRDSVSEGVGVGVSRGNAVTYVVGSSEGVGGVWGDS